MQSRKELTGQHDGLELADTVHDDGGSSHEGPHGLDNL